MPQYILTYVIPKVKAAYFQTHVHNVPLGDFFVVKVFSYFEIGRQNDIILMIPAK